MFYSETSLRKGGRFHLCWVADSWPARLDSTTQRQLLSQDIPKTCDDLMKVITTESSQPSQRFSLRLSSQLMLGLARVYQKKVDSVIADLHMLNATTMKNSNKRFNIDYAAEEVERRMVPMLELPAPVREPIPEPEETFEEMQSGSVVPNIESITLKEAAIPDFQLPPNDGFGEVDPDQAWQLLRDLTLEQMLGASGPHTLTHSALDASAPAQAPEQAWQLLRDLTLEQMLGASGTHTLTHSALDASAHDPEQAWQLFRDFTPEQMLGASGPHTLTHSALDASAPAQAAELVPGLELHNTNTMERMAVCDVTSFRKSTAQDLLREESDKEIPIPEIPPPDLPIPNEKEKLLPEPEEPGQGPEEPAEVPAAAEALPQEPEILTLEMTQPEQPPVEVEVESRQCGSASSESAPGSLDTAGDSDHTTDSEGFIRDQWGTEGTMVKIMKMVKAEIRPLNMDSLMSFGPMVPGCKRIIATRCFMSIMNLKEHGFIKIRKDPDTSEILDIFLGPKFDTC